MEPREAIHTCENAMRNIIRLLMGDTWPGSLNSSQRSQIRKSMENESNDRDGVVHSDDLLAFADTRHLTAIIEKNWPVFQPVFKNETRIKVSFEALNSYRRTVSHSRELRPFERDLLSGISGQIRNMVTLHLNTISDTRQHYPVIESAIDSLGHVGSESFYAQPMNYPLPVMKELEVGDAVTFDAQGWDPRDRRLDWSIVANNRPFMGAEVFSQDSLAKASGDTVSMTLLITEDLVGLELFVAVVLRSETKHRKHKDIASLGYDDRRCFVYRVNPPM